MRGPSSRARSGRVDPPGRWTAPTGSSPGTGTVCPGIVGLGSWGRIVAGSWGCERPDRARAPPCPGPHPRRRAGDPCRPGSAGCSAACPAARMPERTCGTGTPARRFHRAGRRVPFEGQPMSALIETATAGHPAAPLAPRPADAATLGPGAVGGRSGVHAPESGGRLVFTLPLPPQRFGPARVAAGVQEDAACSD